MLVLSRLVGESLRIGEIRVTVVKVVGNKVRLAVEAPLDVPVHREEVWAQIKKGEGNANP
jgi:carbon storage regulator